MAELRIRLTYDTGRFITRAVGINLETIPIDANNEGKADIDVPRTYYFTAHFVVNKADTTFTAQLIPPSGYRIRFPGYSKDASTIITWTAGQANRDYFQRRRFYLRKKEE